MIAGGFEWYWDTYDNTLDKHWMGNAQLPLLFQRGGFCKWKNHRGKNYEEQRALAIMAWVNAHEFEHRAWLLAWGPQEVPDQLEDTCEDWTIFHEPAPSPYDAVFGHT